MTKLFGTDGVRGRANEWPMTPDVIMKIAIAASRHFKKGDHRHVVVIGKDTRLSGYMIEPALTSGFISMGMNVMLLGPIPTPAVSMLVPSLRADFGVMISASHNPYFDNGIKFFDSHGHKLDIESESAIEDAALKESFASLPNADRLGRAQRLDDASGRYIESVKGTFPKKLRLDGLKIVIDCANGAAYKVAPTVLWELGADVIPIGIYPNGFNINKDLGATDVKSLQATVRDEGAHIGIALDGDADRLVMCDENGQLIDGDKLIGIIASYWHKNGRLRGGAVVGTVMSNLGLESYIKSIGLDFIRTPVGDKYIADILRKKNINLGGEQSGHIILNDYAHTGDGLVAALQVLSLVVEEQKAFSEISKIYETVPQQLRNIKLKNHGMLEHPVVQQAIEFAQKSMDGNGQLLIRKSGTEPLLRLMAQSVDHQLVNDVLDELEMVISRQNNT
jgi:phosphoglucosamine mutase